jgi:outer membrane lipoprotein-sorting protein
MCSWRQKRSSTSYSIIRETAVKGFIIRGAALAALLFLVIRGASASDDPQEVLESVRKKYDTIRDAELKFTQRTRFPQSTLEQRAKGTLYLKKEHKYRIETDDQTVVTDGETVWSYSVPNRQVLIDRFKSSERSFSPERILGGGATDDYAATVRGREKAGNTECIVLKLIPRTEGSLVSSLRLWVDPSEWLVRMAELTDVNGKVTTYTVSDIKLNPGLSDSRFVLQIPEGAEVVDMR